MRVVIIISFVLITACASQPVKPIEVLIPTQVPCPEPPVVVLPEDPVNLLGDDVTLADVVKAYRTSRFQWRETALKLNSLLDSYRRAK